MGLMASLNVFTTRSSC